MARQLLLDRINLPLPLEDETIEETTAATIEEELTAYRDSLVASYLSYLKSAGYSQLVGDIRHRESGAWSFICRFPDPTDWPNLEAAELLCLSSPQERSFLHYLFLRRIVPLPPAYLLMPRTHLYEMAMRLMERETYQAYQKAAERVGYRKQDSRNQFRPLLCLMVWAQKPLEALTPEDLEDFIQALRAAYSASKKQRKYTRQGLPTRWDSHLKSVRNVLYYMGIFPQLKKSTRAVSFEKQWERVPLPISTIVHRYLQQLALSFRPESAYQEKTRLFHFFSWLAQEIPEVTRINLIQRSHIEAFKEYLCWVPLQHKSNHSPGDTLSPNTRRGILSSLLNFFIRLTEWQWPEAPKRTLMFIRDLPPLERPLPRFLDEVTAAKFLQAARTHPDLFTRLCGVTLLFTGLRHSEFLGLTADAMVQIGENYWLRVPLGKTYHDRYVPLSPEVKQLLDEWNRQHPPAKPYDFLFIEHGQRYGKGRVPMAVERIAKAAGIQEHVHPHRLRHTLATMAINRGMPLESVAALLGHRSLSMTMVYARIANRTVQQEYSQVSQHLEELCNQVNIAGDGKDATLPTLMEGKQMRQLRKETWRLLGNGYCTRPDGVLCEYETICESCPCFSTTIDFLPILQKQNRMLKRKDKPNEWRYLNGLFRVWSKPLLKLILAKINYYLHKCHIIGVPRRETKWCKKRKQPHRRAVL